MVITPGTDLMLDLVASHFEAMPVTGSGSSSVAVVTDRCLARFFAALEG